jgi:LPS sulfotransferase NodH
MSEERCLILCATQRSGSTMMLDDILNVAGRWPANGEILSDALLTTNAASGYPVRDWDTAWNLAREKNRLQNLIVLKVMFNYIAHLSTAIRGEQLPVPRRVISTFKPQDFDAFYNFFPNAVWVLVERRDLFAQAVSIHVAETINLWEIRRNSMPSSAEPRPRPPYDRLRLLGYLRKFITQREQWHRFFDHYKISPLRLTYEDAVDNYPGYLDEVFAVTGLVRAEKVSERRLVKVGDVTNEHYARLLRDDALLDLYGRMAGSA